LSPLREFSQNSFFYIPKRGFAAKYFVINSYIRWLDVISLMTETKKTGIDRFHLNIIRIFFFDLPGQSTEICSTFAGRTVGINCYFNHNKSSPYQNLEADKFIARHNHFVQVFLAAFTAELIFFQYPEAKTLAARK